MKVVAVCLAVLLLLGVWERLALHRLLSRIPIRIVVNGTRGKTTVVSLLTAALNEAGIPAVGRSTGSDARFLLPDGSVKPIDRRRGINLIREQRMACRLACLFHAEALVSECSAIRPEIQRAFQRQLMEPTLTVITNCYVDHVDRMGNDRDTTARILTDGVHHLYTADPLLAERYHGFLAETVEVPEGIPAWVHPDCYRVALAVCKALGIAADVANRGMAKAVGDIGLSGDLVVSGKRFINAFARNDVTTTIELLSQLEPGSFSMVYANRKDREFRLKRFAQAFQKAGITSLFVIGDAPSLSRRVFAAYGIKALSVPFAEIVQESRQTVVLTGNIKGSGERLLAFLKERM